MSFAARISRMPIPFEPEPGREAAQVFSGLAPELRTLIEGAAGCSPYLRELMTREAEWLRVALAGDPAAALDDALAIDAGDGKLLATALRRAKARVALLAGLADLGGVWTLEEVTGALTRLADVAVQTALGYQIGREIARAKLPGQGEADIASMGGAVALAMGKMGAHELNYSSDIDLILLFDESRYDRDDFLDARAALIRAVRRAMPMLSERTGDGYVFRTDLRLRPDPAVTPVILTMEAAERYYESLGRTWERAAMIKARPCAGDIAAGAAYLDRLAPFVWRKHLDFAAIQDAHDIRLRIRKHKGLGGTITLEGHDMKLGRGGIREIEFFTQTRQLIAGGRDPALRLRGTVPALAALAEKGWVPPEAAEVLTRHYRAHREVEHRVQMVRDAQTHKLPTTEAGFARLAAMMGQGDVAALRGQLRARLEEVHALTESFFTPGGRPPPAHEISAETAAIVNRWRTYPALRSPRAVRIFERLQPDLIDRLGGSARPHEALVAVDGFLKGLPAGVQIFSLFEANPTLIDLIVDIAATSPGLAAYLGRNAQVLDAVIGGDFFSAWPGPASLRAELAARLAAAGDYEAQLDAARRWTREWHFRIGVHLLRGVAGAAETARHYADLAGAVLSALWPAVVAEFGRKHGPPPGRGAAVIGMGSLGAGRLHSHSDLDLIVIYDPDGQEASDGPRPLAARAYYARLTQAFVTALTAPMAEGTLYEVDMRLRPSGRQGPVATSLESFRAYQRDEAWTWEHLALTRARCMAGEAAVGADVEAVRTEVLAGPFKAARVAADTAEMRERIREAKGEGGDLETKLGPGRLQDIELIAQMTALLSGRAPHDTPGQIAAGCKGGWVEGGEAGELTAAHEVLWKLRAASKLLTDDTLVLDDIGQGGRDFLLRVTGMDSAPALCDVVAAAADRAACAIEAILARAGAETGDE